MNFANVTSLTIPEGSVKAIYCNDVKLWGVGGTYENTITGVPPLTLANCTGDDLVSWSMVGNTVQDGTPSPENPVDVQGVGDWDETEQKYKIPVKTNDTTTNIYLNSPLMTGETITSEGERDVEWGKYEIKGTETIGKYSSAIDSYTYWFDFLGVKGNDKSNYKCDRLQSIEYIPTTIEAIRYSAGTRRGVFFVNFGETIMNEQTSGNSVTGLKEYFANQYNAGTPVTVYYQLATPTAETFTPPSIPTQSGTTVLDTDCVVAPSEMTLTFMSTTPQNEETR